MLDLYHTTEATNIAPLFPDTCWTTAPTSLRWTTTASWPSTSRNRTRWKNFSRRRSTLTASTARPRGEPKRGWCKAPSFSCRPWIDQLRDWACPWGHQAMNRASTLLHPIPCFFGSQTCGGRNKIKPEALNSALLYTRLQMKYEIPSPVIHKQI